MAAKLTFLDRPEGPLEGRIALSEERVGWRVEQQGGDKALGERLKIPPGRYEVCGRATTTQPGKGHPEPAWDVYVFDADAGLCAVKTTDADFVAA